MWEHKTESLYKWLTDLFPICRSLTGVGVRQTLTYLKTLVPDLNLHSLPSGTKVFDWTVPEEWAISEAWIADEFGNRLVDFGDNNLHVIGYSEPVDQWLTSESLSSHLYYLPNLPEAIPYVTSYYQRNWGFCVTKSQYDQLSIPNSKYRVVIRSDLFSGELNYADLLIRGDTEQEVLLSTYICHPSLANNELSGPVVVAALARWLANRSQLRFSYRIVFVPETIGSLAYLYKHLEYMKAHTVAGFVVTCVGDTKMWSMLASRFGNTLADRVIRHTFKALKVDYSEYSFLDRGSDERQYCAPGIDLPVASLMRSKYDTYPEYHTSLDNLDFVSQRGLDESLRAYQKCIELIERNHFYYPVVLGEPQLGRRDLYPTESNSDTWAMVSSMMNVLAYADGNHDILAIADRIGLTAFECADIAERLRNAGVLRRNGDDGYHHC